MAENREKVTVGGIEVDFDKAKLADMRFTVMLGDLSDETLDEGAKLTLVAQMLRFMFGGERYKIMDALAEKNGGALTGDEFVEWWTEFLGEVGAKN